MFGISRAEYDEALDRIQDLRERVWAIEQREHQREADADHDEEARDLAELLTVAQGRVEDLEKRNAALEQSLKDARRNRDQWRESSQEFKQMVDEQHGRIEELEQQLRDDWSSWRKWRDAAKSFEQVAQDREQEIRLLQDEIATLEGRLNEARAQR